MTSNELSRYVGGTYLFHTHKGPGTMAVQVRCVDARVSYGDVHVQITPVAGSGLVWVSFRALTEVGQ